MNLVEAKNRQAQKNVVVSVNVELFTAAHGEKEREKEKQEYILLSTHNTHIRCFFGASAVNFYCCDRSLQGKAAKH